MEDTTTESEKVVLQKSGMFKKQEDQPSRNFGPPITGMHTHTTNHFIY